MQGTKQKSKAKEYLMAYSWAIRRRDALMREIERLYERAIGTTVDLTADVVTHSAPKDGFANAAVQLSEKTCELSRHARKIERALSKTLKAIESVPEERQRLLLTLKYVRGLEWKEISQEMHYEKTQLFILHGRALQAVERWMRENGKTIDSIP